MRVKGYDFDGFGEPFAKVHLKQDDINLIFKALNEYKKMELTRNINGIGVIEKFSEVYNAILDIDDKFLELKNERE